MKVKVRAWEERDGDDASQNGERVSRVSRAGAMTLREMAIALRPREMATAVGLREMAVALRERSIADRVFHKTFSRKLRTRMEIALRERGSGFVS